MNHIQPTTLFTYLNEIKPTLGERQKAVYEELKKRGNATNKELAHWFNCDACSITGRIKELREMGLVRLSTMRKCNVTGRNVIAWEVGKII